MRKHTNTGSHRGEKSLEELLAEVPHKERDPNEFSRKISINEFYQSPEFQRRTKIAREKQEQARFQRELEFRQAQQENPIKGKPRKKRGRKQRT